MRLKELRAKSASDLQKLLAQKREALRADRFSISAKQLKDVKAIIKTKKLIAQILTILNEKRQEGEEKKELSRLPARQGTGNQEIDKR